MMNQMNEIEHEQAGNQVELVKYRTVNPKDSFILDDPILPYHKRKLITYLSR